MANAIGWLTVAIAAALVVLQVAACTVEDPPESGGAVSHD
jgi:hypothetical protein